MKKNNKKFFLIIINIILIISFFFGIEFFIYKVNTREYPQQSLPFTYLTEQSSTIENCYNKEDYACFTEAFGYGREPNGLNYVKNKQNSIIIFGCSFAYGEGLEPNQTLSYKLSNYIQTPIFNRALSGGGLAQMYYQVNKDEFYDDIIYEPNSVIYCFIDDHFRRLLVDFFIPLDTRRNLRYLVKDNSLVKTEDNSFINFIKSLYIVKKLNQNYSYTYMDSEKNTEIITDLVVLYFKETKKILEKRYNKQIKFTILFYNQPDTYANSLLINKLKNNGFNIVTTDELTDENLNNEEWLLPSDKHHPNEKAWDLLVPKIAERIL